MFSIFSMGLVSGVIGHRDQYALAVSPVEAVKTEQLAVKNVAGKMLSIQFFRSAKNLILLWLKSLELFVIIK